MNAEAKAGTLAVTREGGRVSFYVNHRVWPMYGPFDTYESARDFVVRAEFEGAQILCEAEEPAPADVGPMKSYREMYEALCAEVHEVHRLLNDREELPFGAPLVERVRALVGQHEHRSEVDDRGVQLCRCGAKRVTLDGGETYGEWVAP